MEIFREKEKAGKFYVATFTPFMIYIVKSPIIRKA